MTSDSEDNEGLRDACGVLGIIASEWPTKLDISNLICIGLVGLQHRFICTKSRRTREITHFKILLSIK